jgi:hypothetical protein
MTPADLRAICESLNDERGTGGQTRLARLLDWHHSSIWRKLTGKSPITQADELAICQAVQTLPPFSSKRKGTPRACGQYLGRMRRLGYRNRIMIDAT